jgi:hypothetical protein
MRYRTGELNMPDPLTTNLGLNDLNATLLTDNPSVTEALVLPADTLIVLHRTKDLGTKEAISLRL